MEEFEREPILLYLKQLAEENGYRVVREGDKLLCYKSGSPSYEMYIIEDGDIQIQRLK